MVHSEIMPVHRTSFESLDLARLENYVWDILNDPEVPETRAAWMNRLKALGLMVDSVTDEPVCTIAGLILFGIRPRQFFRQSGLRIMFFNARTRYTRHSWTKYWMGRWWAVFRSEKRERH